MLSNIQNCVSQAVKSDSGGLGYDIGGLNLASNKSLRKYNLTESVMSPLPTGHEANEQLDNIEKRQEEMASALKSVESMQTKLIHNTSAINERLQINGNTSGNIGNSNSGSSVVNMNENEITKLTQMNVKLMEEMRELKRDLELKTAKTEKLTNDCENYRIENLRYKELKSKMEEQIRYLNESKLRTINNMVDEMNQMREKILALSKKKRDKKSHS